LSANHEFRGLVRRPMGRMSARNAHLGTIAPLEARVLPRVRLTPGTCGTRVRVRVRVSAELVRDRTGYFNRKVEVEVSTRANQTELTTRVGRQYGRLELASFIR